MSMIQVYIRAGDAFAVPGLFVHRDERSLCAELHKAYERFQQED